MERIGFPNAEILTIAPQVGSIVWIRCIDDSSGQNGNLHWSARTVPPVCAPHGRQKGYSREAMCIGLRQLRIMGRFRMNCAYPIGRFSYRVGKQHGGHLSVDAQCGVDAGAGDGARARAGAAAQTGRPRGPAQAERCETRRGAATIPKVGRQHRSGDGARARTGAMYDRRRRPPRAGRARPAPTPAHRIARSRARRRGCTNARAAAARMSCGRCG